MRKMILLGLIPLVLSFTNNADALRGYEFPKLNGETVVYEEIVNLDGKTVLFFWTSWCYFCRRELSKINQQSLAGDDVKFYYINLGETAKIVDYVAEKMKLKDFIIDNVILDEDTIFAQEFGIIGLPTYIFLKDGRFLYRTNLINPGVVERVFSDE